MSLATAHNSAVRAPIDHMTAELQALLSRRVTAYLAGVRDAKTITRWASGEIASIRDFETEQRLRTAYTVATLLREVEDDATIRAWFVSLNPYLGDFSPADAIRNGESKDVLDAARNFAANA